MLLWAMETSRYCHGMQRAPGCLPCAPKGGLHRPRLFQRPAPAASRQLSTFSAGDAACRAPQASQAPDAAASSPAPAAQEVSPAWRSRLPQVLMATAAVAAVACCWPAASQAAAQAASSTGGDSLVKGMISFILHLDKHLSAMIQQHGTATYAILWTIVFCETGLVLTPFLPGDSLLFAAGAFAGMGQLNLGLLFGVFMTSAVLGDAVNYAIGSKLGTWALERNLLKQQYIQQTEKFYAKYGGKTVVLARFVPIVRTFAPFVAGIGSMAYSKFALYNVLGALIWTVLFLGAGYFFGNLPVVQHNFTLVVLGIVAVSVVPVILEVLAARREAQQGEGSGGSAVA